MELDVQKKNIKDVLEDLSLIDLQGEINTKGNYIYLSSFKAINAVGEAYVFTVVLADYSLDASDANLEKTLGSLIETLKQANFRRKIFLEGLEATIKKKDDLLFYECKVTVTNIDIG